MKKWSVKTCWHRALAVLLAVSMVLIPVRFPGHAHAVTENPGEHSVLFEDDFTVEKKDWQQYTTEKHDVTYSWSRNQWGREGTHTHSIVDGVLNIHTNNDRLSSHWYLNCTSDGQDIDQQWTNYTVRVDIEADRPLYDVTREGTTTTVENTTWAPGIVGRVTPVYEADGKTVKGYAYYEVRVDKGNVKITKSCTDDSGKVIRSDTIGSFSQLGGAPSGEKRTLEVIFEDNRITVKVYDASGALINPDKTAADRTYMDLTDPLLTGGVGLAFIGGTASGSQGYPANCPWSAQYDNFEVTLADGSFEFTEDFGTESTDDDATAMQYMTAGGTRVGALTPKVWGITDSGAYASTGDPSVSYVAAEGAEEWTDYIVKADMVLDATDGVGSLIARYSDDGYYEMRVNADGTVGLYRSGVVDALKTYDFESALDSSVEAKLEVLGTKLIGFIGGEVVVEYDTKDDENRLTAGTAGVASGTGVTYDNFSVTEHVWPETWEVNENSHWRDCTVANCGTEDKANHTSVDDGDCTTAVQCPVCGKVTTAAQEHSYTNYVDNGGRETATCDNNSCNCTDTRVSAEISDTSANVIISAGQLEAIANAGNGSSFSVNSDILDLTFDNAALKKILADNGTEAKVTIVMENVTDEGVDNKLKFDIGLKVGEEEFSNFGDGKVTVVIPLTDLNLTDDQTVEVWYIKDGKRSEKMDAKQADGAVTFQTSHFSVFEVSEVGDYTADISADKTDVKVGDNVAITVNVGGTTGSFASSQVVLSYDSNYLTFDADGDHFLSGATISENNGIITIVDYGDTEYNGAVYVLNFTAKAATNSTTVTLESAGFSTADDAETANLTPTDTNELSISVTPADLNVTLDNGLKSDDGEKVEYNGTYTFYAEDPYYDYTISVNDSAVIPSYDENTGKWTITDVTADLNITIVTQTAKTFNVSIIGTDAINDNPGNVATYKENYTFTLKDNVVSGVGTPGYTYSVESITIGGKTVPGSWTNSGRVYTINGDYINGDIVIKTKVTEIDPNKFTVTVENGGSELTADKDQVDKGGSVTLTLTPVVGYDYAVTINDMNVDLGEWTFDDDDGTYTYTINGVTENVVVSLSKELDLSEGNVSVSTYLTLNGKTVYLVQVTTKLDSGYVYTYGGQNMYWSAKYNSNNGANAFLVIMDNESPEGTSQTLTLEDAIANINISTGSATTVDYSGNVNMADASTVDANDAQLVYNMYQTKAYNEFTNNVTMEKFLRADVNGSGTITVEDAAAIVNTILESE